MMDRTAGSSPRSSLPSWLFLGTLAAASLHPSCGPATDTGSSLPSATVTALLTAVGPQVVVPALDRFIAEAELLEASLSGEQAASQAQWQATMIAWQELEVMQIGPLGSSLTAAGGQDGRDEIYSWPTVNPCLVDQETVRGEYGGADFFTTRLVNAYGLDALEHLLFYGADNACPSQVDINAHGSWDALGTDGVAAARGAYAAAVTAEVIRQGRALRDAWTGGFSDALGAGADPYEDDQEALNAVFDALFYLESITKDEKLAVPLGGGDCGAERCPEDVELPESDTSLAAIEANLVGFRSLLTGGDDTGFDDLLTELGHEDLAQEMTTTVDAAIAAVAAVEGPLEEAVESRPEQAQALHDAVKAVTDLLKGDLATVFALQIPDEAAGDAD